MLLLSSLIISWAFDTKANNFNNELNSNSISRSDNHPRARDFDWGNIKVISEPIEGQDNNIDQSRKPKIAVEDDKIYVVWQDNTDFKSAGDDYDIFYRYFDGGKWSEIQVISEPVMGQNLNTNFSLNPDIAVENGNIHLTWQDNTNISNAGIDTDIFYRCNLTGSNWEDIQVISEPVFGKNFNIGDGEESEIVVENGNIHVVWRSFNNTNSAGTDWDIFYRNNLTGQNWEPIQVISESIKGKDLNNGYSTEPEIAVDNNKVYIVWQDDNNTNNASSVNHDVDIFYRCNITRTSWEEIQVISEPIFGKDFNSAGSSTPKIAVENANIHVVWDDNNNSYNSGEDSDIFYRCNITGSSWENIQIISEPCQGVNFNVKGSSRPAIAVENGRIYVVWRDSNETNNNVYGSEIFYKCKFNDHFWEPIQVISEPVRDGDFHIGESHFPDITVTFGKSHIVWRDENDTDNAGTDRDVFYRRIIDPSPLFLNQPNVSPTLGNTSTNFNFTVVYFNYDNKAPTKITVIINSIKYSMVEVNPSDINYLDGKDYYFNVKNLDIGLQNYQFYADDGTYTWSTRIYNSPRVLNSEPLIITKANTTAFEDVSYEVKYDYQDIDLNNVGQIGTWKFSTNADWLTFDASSAILNGTPTNDDVGEYWVNISIDDSIDSDFTNFTLTVLNVNDAPEIITDSIETINEDEFYEIHYKAIDVDTSQDNLNWFVSTNATWLNFDQKSNILSGLPENDDVGNFWVNISVSDGEYFVFSNFTLEVLNVNDPPWIITKEIDVAYEDKYYEMVFRAGDIDNLQNDLIWTIITDAQWLTINEVNSIVNGTPLNDDVGEYWINVLVSDGEYIDVLNFTLTVININDPPLIITEGISNVTVGELFSLNYEAEDIDPSPITFTWSLKTNTSNWLTIDSTTGWLNGLPSDNDVGIYWINVSVTDREGGWDHYNFTLEVLKSPIQEDDSTESTTDSTTISTDTFYGFIWLIIIIVVMFSIIIMLLIRKQKKEIVHILEKREYEVIQTVKAELMQTTPTQVALPGEVSVEGKVEILPQPTVATTTEEQSVKAIGKTPIPEEYQLPKATISEEQIDTAEPPDDIPSSQEAETQEIQPTIVQQDLPPPHQDDEPMKQVEKKENGEL
jgi:hypothetical protein